MVVAPERFQEKNIFRQQMFLYRNFARASSGESGEERVGVQDGMKDFALVVGADLVMVLNAGKGTMPQQTFAVLETEIGPFCVSGVGCAGRRCNRCQRETMVSRRWV